jgi:hypothetical protein
MPEASASPLPLLPLLLWRTPPALAEILAQDGIAHEVVKSPGPSAFAVGRFVLVDERDRAEARLRPLLRRDHVLIDVDELRGGFSSDPFTDVLDTRGRLARWIIGGFEVRERVSRVDRRALRVNLLARLRHAINEAGGIWARVGGFPHPYRSAFNLRVDLDEPCPDDYARFARARAPLDDCTTHFISTAAYGRFPSILAELRALDAQSHGHFHTVYRDPAANRRNLARAHAVLERAGIAPTGFAAPCGRWNPGLDAALTNLGYSYSSEFQVAWDDLPSRPWRGDRFSEVLQVPVHPICEGLFLDAGAPDGRAIAEHLANTVRGKVAAGDPAFVYGHPERRLGRYPEIVASLARAVDDLPLTWRVTLTEFARWWRRRARVRWSLRETGRQRLEARFEGVDGAYPLALEIVRGEHVAAVRVDAPRLAIDASSLAFERRARYDAPRAERASAPHGLRPWLRALLDWETATPVEELPDRSTLDRWKKRLRRWRDARVGAGPAGEIRQ